MKSIYIKEIKTYLNHILTYIVVALLLGVNVYIFANEVFNNNLYQISLINYELPIFTLLKWVISLIPILMFLTYTVQKNKRVDTHLYTSNITSFKIVVAKTLAISTIILIPFIIILIINVLLMLTIFPASAMVLTVYILAVLVVLVSASFSTVMYSAFKNPIIALIFILIIQNILMIIFSIITLLEKILFQSYLQGLLPLATTLMLTFFVIVYTIISTLILNKKRNIM